MIILDWKSKGLTDAEVAAKMPISEATVSREINSPQARAIGKALIDKASAIVWPLVERQLEQIEGGNLKPGQQLSFRGQLIKTLSGLVPKQVEQRIEGKIDQQVEVKKHEWTLSELIEEYGDVLPEALEAYTQAAREEDAGRDAEEDSGESVVSDDE